jgi:hypothetical protein
VTLTPNVLPRTVELHLVPILGGAHPAPGVHAALVSEQTKANRLACGLGTAEPASTPRSSPFAIGGSVTGCARCVAVGSWIHFPVTAAEGLAGANFGAALTTRACWSTGTVMRGYFG